MKMKKPKIKTLQKKGKFDFCKFCHKRVTDKESHGFNVKENYWYHLACRVKHEK